MVSERAGSLVQFVAHAAEQFRIRMFGDDLVELRLQVGGQADIVEQNVLHAPRAIFLYQPVIDRHEPFFGMFHGGFHRGAWSCDALFGDANVQPVEKLRRFGVRHPGEELFEQRDKFLLLSGSAGLPMLPQGPLSYRRNVQDGVRLGPG